MGLGGIASSGAVDHLPQGLYVIHLWRHRRFSSAQWLTGASLRFFSASFVDSPATVPAPARHANLASAETPKPSGKIKLSLGKKH